MQTLIPAPLRTADIYRLRKKGCIIADGYLFLPDGWVCCGQPPDYFEIYNARRRHICTVRHIFYNYDPDIVEYEFV